MLEFTECMDSQEKAIRFLFQEGICKRNRACDKCTSEMKLAEKSGRHCWICTDCQQTTSIFKDTIFYVSVHLYCNEVLNSAYIMYITMFYISRYLLYLITIYQ